jgi:hypothetical protein
MYAILLVVVAMQGARWFLQTRTHVLVIKSRPILHKPAATVQSRAVLEPTSIRRVPTKTQVNQTVINSDIDALFFEVIPYT